MAALIHLLAAGVGAYANVTVALDAPSAPLDSGQQHVFRAKLTGTRDETRCWWAVTENGLLVGEAEGVRIAESKDGSVTFSAAAGSTPRTFLLRTTSRLAPSAFAVVEVQVRAGQTAGTRRSPAPGSTGGMAAGAPVDRTPARPMTETKGSAAPANLIWTTSSAGWPATTPRFSQVESICWDPSADRPSVIALLSDYRDLDDEDDENEPDMNRILRIGLDGTTTCLGGGAQFQDGPALTGGFDSGRYVHNRLVARPNGDIIIADTQNHRIRRIRAGQVTTLAGTGSHEPNGDLDENGDPRLATEANLHFPTCAGVMPNGEIVFMEDGGTIIRKITASGHIETIAGTRDGAAPFGVNDLRRRYPATAGRIEASRPFAVAPDGRIVFAQTEGKGTLSAILPDGTLATLASRTDQMAGGEVTELVVTSDNELVFAVHSLVDEEDTWTLRKDLKKLTRDGRVVTLARSFRGKMSEAPGRLRRRDRTTPLRSNRTWTRSTDRDGGPSAPGHADAHDLQRGGERNRLVEGALELGGDQLALRVQGHSDQVDAFAGDAPEFPVGFQVGHEEGGLQVESGLGDGLPVLQQHAVQRVRSLDELPVRVQDLPSGFHEDLGQQLGFERIAGHEQLEIGLDDQFLFLPGQAQDNAAVGGAPEPVAQERPDLDDLFDLGMGEQEPPAPLHQREAPRREQLVQFRRHFGQTLRKGHPDTSSQVLDADPGPMLQKIKFRPAAGAG
jgi:hypothetical protein